LFTIYKTMSSITTFMLFLSIALMIYAHLTYVLCLDTPGATCGDSLFGNFVLSFGLLFSIMDGYTEYPGKQLFLLFVFSLVIPIVLANLLIAIMSNTYNRLSNSQKACDLKCMAEMCIEHEYVVSSFNRFRGNVQPKEYFYIFFTESIKVK
jgi:hypothetical protein